ncbi:MAG: flippase-like domain-containing protein, partial [Ignavibacteriae bacterium]|nr:flippase-like domain-containing protein [Ignavibacteriota bacterium]
MTPRAKTYLRYLISLGLAGVFLYLAFRGTDIAHIFALVKGANYFWILLMFGLLLMSHAVRAWRWRYLLEPIKRNIGFRNLFSSVMVGYMVNNVVPR